MDGDLRQCLAPVRFEMLIRQFYVAAIVMRIWSFYFSCSICALLLRADGFGYLFCVGSNCYVLNLSSGIFFEL